MRKPGKSGDSVAQSVHQRRAFLTRLGAGVSSAVAATAAVAMPASQARDDVAARLALLEDEQGLRHLHEYFEQAVDERRMDDVIAMFADDAEVMFNNGVFQGRGQGVSRLFRKVFVEGSTGRRMAQAPGFELTAEEMQSRLEISSDRLSATAKFSYSIQVGRPLVTESSHASMARLHGEGVETWWEGGAYEVRYIRESITGDWRINHLAYNTIRRADYREGRSTAGAIAADAFTQVYPASASGPDELV